MLFCKAEIVETREKTPLGRSEQSGSPAGQCRRRHTRVERNVAIGIRAAAVPSLLGRCRDVSVGGVGLYLDVEVNIGDRIVFEIPYKGRAHAVQAQVMNKQYVTGPGLLCPNQRGCWYVGLAWVFADSDDARAVRNVLDATRTLSGRPLRPGAGGTLAQRLRRASASSGGYELPRRNFAAAL